MVANCFASLVLFYKFDISKQCKSPALLVPPRKNSCRKFEHLLCSFLYRTNIHISQLMKHARLENECFDVLKGTKGCVNLVGLKVYAFDHRHDVYSSGI